MHLQRSIHWQPAVTCAPAVLFAQGLTSCPACQYLFAGALDTLGRLQWGRQRCNALPAHSAPTCHSAGVVLLCQQASCVCMVGTESSFMLCSLQFSCSIVSCNVQRLLCLESTPVVGLHSQSSCSVIMMTRQGLLPPARLHGKRFLLCALARCKPVTAGKMLAAGIPVRTVGKCCHSCISQYNMYQQQTSSDRHALVDR